MEKYKFENVKAITKVAFNQREITADSLGEAIEILEKQIGSELGRNTIVLDIDYNDLSFEKLDEEDGGSLVLA